MVNSISIADGLCIAWVDSGFQISLDLARARPCGQAVVNQAPSMRWCLGPAGFHLSRLRAPLADPDTQLVIWDVESTTDRVSQKRGSSFIHRVCARARRKTQRDEPDVCVIAVHLHSLDYRPS